MYQRILVAFDGSDTSHRALRHAARLARSEGARVRAICVVEYPSTLYGAEYVDVGTIQAGILEDARHVAEKARRYLDGAGITGESLVVDSGGVGGTVADEIRDAAQDFHSDLVVMGTHGRRGFQRLLLGSVAEAYVRLSSCPVLLVPLKDPDKA